ncbi:MAG: PRTRC system protein A [Azonexus sp.]|nr:PRTRC system protein A [Azonexus sp.]
MMDVRDLALQSACPVIAAPRFGPLPDMVNGQRIILAANGVFVQVKLDWLDCIQRLSPALPIPLPYGGIKERLTFTFGVLPIRLIEAFIEAGRRGLPNEVAGALIYSRRSRSLRLALCEPLDVSPHQIDYRVPAMDADETLAVDLHTHGHGLPFWSAKDDRDDQGIKVAGVLGCLHQPKPSALFRLAVNGRFHPLPHPWQADTTAPHYPEPDLEPGLLRRILSFYQGRRFGPWNT